MGNYCCCLGHSASRRTQLIRIGGTRSSQQLISPSNTEMREIHPRLASPPQSAGLGLTPREGDIAEVLLSIPFLQHLGADRLHTLARAFQHSVHRSGSTFLQQNQFVDSCHVVLRGQLCAMASAADDGTPIVLRDFLPGDWVFEWCVLANDYCPLNIKAVDDTVVASLSRDAFQRFCTTNGIDPHSITSLILTPQHLKSIPLFNSLLEDGADQYNFLQSERSQQALSPSARFPSSPSPSSPDDTTAAAAASGGGTMLTSDSTSTMQAPLLSHEKPQSTGSNAPLIHPISVSSSSSASSSACPSSSSSSTLPASSSAASIDSISPQMQTQTQSETAQPPSVPSPVSSPASPRHLHSPSHSHAHGQSHARLASPQSARSPRHTKQQPTNLATPTLWNKFTLLCLLFTYQRFRKGNVAVNQGVTVSKLYLILSGSFSPSTISRSSSVTLAPRASGSRFLEAAFMSRGMTAPATFTCAEDSSLVVSLSRDSFAKCVRLMPELLVSYERVVLYRTSSALLSLPLFRSMNLTATAQASSPVSPGGFSPVEQLQIIGEMLVLEQCPAGSVIIEPGKPKTCEKFYIVVAGQVELSTPYPPETVLPSPIPISHNASIAAMPVSPLQLGHTHTPSHVSATASARAHRSGSASEKSSGPPSVVSSPPSHSAHPSIQPTHSPQASMYSPFFGSGLDLSRALNPQQLTTLTLGPGGSFGGQIFLEDSVDQLERAVALTPTLLLTLPVSSLHQLSKVNRILRKMRAQVVRDRSRNPHQSQYSQTLPTPNQTQAGQTSPGIGQSNEGGQEHARLLRIQSGDNVVEAEPSGDHRWSQQLVVPAAGKEKEKEGGSARGSVVNEPVLGATSVGRESATTRPAASAPVVTPQSEKEREEREKEAEKDREASPQAQAPALTITTTTVASPTVSASTPVAVDRKTSRMSSRFLTASPPTNALSTPTKSPGEAEDVRAAVENMFKRDRNKRSKHFSPLTLKEFRLPSQSPDARKLDREIESVRSKRESTSRRGSVGDKSEKSEKDSQKGTS